VKMGLRKILAFFQGTFCSSVGEDIDGGFVYLRE